MSGMIFRKPPALEVGPIKDLAENITLTGKTLVDLAEDVVEEQLGPTRCGVLVDFPDVDLTKKTAEQAKAAGARPYASLYKAEDILDWRFISVGSNNNLGMVKLQSVEEEPDPQDEFGTVCKKVIRVLDLDEGRYRIRTYREGQKKGAKEPWGLASTVYPRINGKNFDYIPFVFFGERG